MVFILKGSKNEIHCLLLISWGEWERMFYDESRFQNEILSFLKAY